ncbi:MAG: amidohydrolase family protein [Bryobacteraceae bacterium]|nr:amidohydrolase family protein [Bryobacteraceae bacterium]
MRDRREFIQSAALGAGLGATMSGMQSAESGKIDCQSHIFVPELIRMMEKRNEPPYVRQQDGGTVVVVGDWVRRLQPQHTDAGAKLRDMDEAGIAMTGLSINDPGPELFGAEGPAVARLVNDYVADITRKHPARFFGLMVLPLQNIDESLKEMERCVGRLGMKGILLYSNLAGKWPDEPQFRPMFEQAVKLDLPVLLHPAYPMTYEATKGYTMAAGLGLMFDTTIALARIILAGILDQYPALKLVCPHVGGTLPYLIGRLDHQTQVLKRGAENIKRPPSEYLKQVWLDTVSPIALAIRYGIDFAGEDRMLYASDHPWVDPKMITGLVKSLKLPASMETKIFTTNARRLFRL